MAGRVHNLVLRQIGCAVAHGSIVLPILRAAFGVAVVVERAADDNRAAGACIARADAVGSILALRGGHFGYACSNRDGAATAHLSLL